jgi:hypothetical protein
LTAQLTLYAERTYRNFGETVAAYNAVVDASPKEFLLGPPPYFLAIKAALAELVGTVRRGA